MDEAELKERLMSHGKAFEGLMSLIPAKFYYEQDNSDQWHKKKQTAEQRAAARKAKLDPDNIKSAKDIMDENQRKRKRELDPEADADDVSSLEGVEKEKPREGMKSKKKQKTEGLSADADEQERRSKADKRKEKRERKKEKEKADKQKEKEKQKKKDAKRREAKKSKAKGEKGQAGTADNEIVEPLPQKSIEDDLTDEESVEAAAERDTVDAIDVAGLIDEQTQPTPTDAPSDISSTSPPPDSTFSVASEQPPSSKSSIDHAPTDQSSKSDLHPLTAFNRLSATEKEAAKARLHARLEEMRAARKADGADGNPVRSRSELLEIRRQREEKRKEQKKEKIRATKEDDSKSKMEAELARLRGSGSPLGSDIFSRASTDSFTTSYTFGRLNFNDGQQYDMNGKLIEKKSSRGPSDPRTALEAVANRKARLAGLDDDKREDIEDKEAWLNVKKKAHGERVRDDESLLKKALKRKEKAKSKSERKWLERQDAIKKAQYVKQKKREDNLAKRKAEKGVNKNKKAKNKAFGSLGGKRK